MNLSNKWQVQQCVQCYANRAPTHQLYQVHAVLSGMFNQAQTAANESTHQSSRKNANAGCRPADLPVTFRTLPVKSQPNGVKRPT
jgi:hypothetical protein